MSSVIPNFEYDIFVSYRHNDNLPTPGAGSNSGSGWVSDFVQNLERELRATIKSPVSVYLDTSPHDGLLETHQVGKSLEGKLKSFIFIPILSQTYCDPKSFAWQNEFCVFHALSKSDSYGTDIRLKNGNVASRILPVKIHDLDAADNAMLEYELGGVPRAVEFIFQEPGVNRPLAVTDNRSDNQKKTDYRNQLNKVANAIRDLLAAANSAGDPAATAAAPSIHPSPFVKRRIILAAFGILTFIGLIYSLSIVLGLPEMDSSDKSIAVLPFVDMTPSGDMEYLGDGIAEEIINSLTSIRELNVIGRTSSFQFKGQKIDLREVGEKLRVGIVLEGSIQKYNDSYRITAQLVRTDDNFHIWSQRFDMDHTDIFKIQDNIASAVVEKLRLALSSPEQTRIQKKPINEEAYTLYLKGLFHYKATRFKECIVNELNAIRLDSSFAPAYALVGLSKAWVNYHSGKPPDSILTKEALMFSERAIELDPDLAEGYSAIALISWRLQNDFAKSKTFFEKSLALNPNGSLIKNRYSYLLTWMGDFEKASLFARDAIKLDPADFNSYAILFNVALSTGQLDEAATHLREWKNLVGPTFPIFNNQLRLDLANGSFARVLQRCDSAARQGEPPTIQQLVYRSVSNYKLDRRRESDADLARLKKMAKDEYAGSGFFAVAEVHAYRNEPDSSFAYLSLAANRKEPDFVFLKIEPSLKALRSDPRYVRLCTQYGFDKY
ncbi:MAG: hypothetical protein SH819_03170 [Cytophagales bacterium]|nr:hypothetical protein [Cytophagales bacterium]